MGLESRPWASGDYLRQLHRQETSRHRTDVVVTERPVAPSVRRMECHHCGGTHKNVPVERLTTLNGEYGSTCPHCGNFHDMDVDGPDDLETHPAVPDSEPATCVCRDCNGSFKVQS